MLTRNVFPGGRLRLYPPVAVITLRFRSALQNWLIATLNRDRWYS